jgi:hypothetical protein
MVAIEAGQRWTHKLTSMSFRVILVDEDDVLLEPEGDGQELTLTQQLLLQEFKCPEVRNPSKKKNQRRIKPGKIRRGVRR